MLGKVPSQRLAPPVIRILRNGHAQLRICSGTRRSVDAAQGAVRCALSHSHTAVRRNLLYMAAQQLLSLKRSVRIPHDEPGGQRILDGIRHSLVKTIEGHAGAKTCGSWRIDPGSINVSAGSVHWRGPAKVL